MSAPLPDTRPFAGFEWKLALRYLRARRKEGFISVISLFSLLGIMLGVATLIVVMSVFNGFHNELLSKVLGYSGHATIYDPNLEPVTEYEALQKKLEATPGVTQAIAFVEGQVLASSARTSTGAFVRGMSEKDIQKIEGINNAAFRSAMKEPGVLDEKPTFEGFDKSGGVIVGEGMARRHQLVLGDAMKLITPNGEETVIGETPASRDYIVVGIFAMGMSEYDDNVAYLPLTEAQDLFGDTTGVTGIEIRVEDPEAIREMLGPLREVTGGNKMIQTWQDRNAAFFSALIVERNMLFIVVGMVVLVAALNIISSLIMLVKDKSRDIAILRTMGATASAMMRVFFITGASIGVVGTILGLILGTIICLNVENIRQLVQSLSGTDVFNKELYYLSKLPADIEPMQVLWIVLLALGLSFLATLYPAWRASKLDPVEALRYE